MRHAFLVSLLCALLTAGLVAAGDLYVPKGWRLPTKADEKYDWVEFAKAGRAPNRARADFNGDGVPDDAYIALATAGKGWALFVNLNGKHGNPQVIQLYENSGDTIPQRMGVDVAAPGKYETACGKGYGRCKSDEPLEIDLKLPAINFVLFESANCFYWWDRNAGKFQCTGISD